MLDNPLWQPSEDLTALSQLPWAQDMANCPQDPKYHAEGDVWTHTQMVVRELLNSIVWQMLEDIDQRVLFTAAVLHDVGKPARTRMENGKLTSPGHGAMGALIARRILWEAGLHFNLREQVVGLIRWHQIPYIFLERRNPTELIILASQTARCDHLMELATADTKGRSTELFAGALDSLKLFEGEADSLDCLDQPWAFQSDHSRVNHYYHGGSPFSMAWDIADTNPELSCTVTLMSGLPGAGKDTWLATQSLPIVSLDDIRVSLKIKPIARQGRVVQAAKEAARVYLREHQSFAWNATNLSRDTRLSLVSLFLNYKAHVRIVYIEASAIDLWNQNISRADAVPRAVIEKLLNRWDVPTLPEAHEIIYQV